MTRKAKIANLLTVVLPPLIILACIVVFWNDIVGPHDLVVALAMYLVSGFGITIGFHRMLTHRSFRTSKPVEYLFAAAGSMAVQGPVINWVADHRKHHAFPRSATHGLGRLELDPSAALIWTMEKLGLVWDVVRITPERQTQRMAPAVRDAPLTARRAP